MMHRTTFGLLGVCLLFGAGGNAVAAQKNVVLVVADDLGLQLGCYGDTAIKTPHLDRLASEGTRFTRAYCTTASCSASRSVLLTGLYNHATAHYGHEHGSGHFRTFDEVQSLPARLKRAGYRTCRIGKYHLAPEAVYPFDTVGGKVDGGLHNSVGLVATAQPFLAAADERPFFLYIGFQDPHRNADPTQFANHASYPGVTPVQYDPDQLRVPAWLPDQPDVRREWAEYCQAISRMDQGMGALLATLEATGHRDDTLVIFLSDNGPPFPGAKTTLYEPGMNLPLLVRLPKSAKRGVVCDALVTWADITPTILDFAGVNVPTPVPNAKGKTPIAQTLHGRSFLGIVEQDHPAGWTTAFASHTFHEITMYYPMRAVIDGEYKYILNLASPLPFPFASDLYDSPTWQGVLKRGDTRYGQRTIESFVQRPRHELYNLASDPGELRNLADDPQHAERLAALQKKLRDWQRATSDPWVTKWVYE